MNRDEALKQSEDALQDLAEALRQGKSESLVRYLDMLSRFHHYSFGNCLLIAIQKPDATLVAGFQRWKDLHRWVKKGEKGIGILAPLVGRKRDSMDADQDDAAAAKERKLYGFRVVYVFDVSQTEGQELPALGEVSGDPGEKLLRLQALIQTKCIELRFVESLFGALGMSEGGRISVLSSLGPAEMFATLVHELAHELLHRGDRRKETTKVVRETEAEAVAYVVCRASGLEVSTQSSDYIQLWNGDVSVLMQSLELVREVASDIITALEAEIVEEVARVA